MRTVFALVLALAAAVVSQPVSTQERASASPASADLPLNLIKLPPGFKIDAYASGVTNARELAIGPKGTVFVGSRNKPDGDKVYALVDKNGDQKADQVLVIAKGLNQPNGVAVHNGSLYVGEISRITRFDNIESRLESPGEPVVVNDALPDPTASFMYRSAHRATSATRRRTTPDTPRSCA